MSLKKYLKTLEKRKVISKRPNPIIPFVITILLLLLMLLYKTQDIFLSILFIFSLIFSIVHLIIYKILTSK